MDLNFVAFRTGLSGGGIPNTGYLLAEAFEKLGEHVTAFADSCSEMPETVDFVKTKSSSEGKGGKRYFLHLLRYFNGHSADIRLCMHWMCGIPCLIRRVFDRTPYAVMVHGNEIMNSQHITIKRFLYEYMRRLVLDRAVCIFAVSRYTKELCGLACNNKNIYVIHAPEQYRSNDTVESNCKKYIIFSIGQHIERKGFQDMISAMPRLRKKYPQIRYRLAGDGPYHEKLVALARELHVDDCVEFLGRISDEQKGEEFSSCDLFVMMSHDDAANMEVEGFGVCYLEANAHGKWVIARDSGGVADAVLDNITGYLLPNSDVDTICEAVDRFYKSGVPDISKLKQWAWLHSPENIAEKYVKVLKKYA